MQCFEAVKHMDETLWGNTAGEPLVSVAVITYNNAPYIGHAIESILMQRTDFPIEIIIGEDCSTDGTRELVAWYARKYSDRIRVLLHPHNLGMNGNACAVRAVCSGKYMAMLDGDNYWLDPLKLQKQVDVLERHPEYVGAAHKVRVVDRNDQLSSAVYYANHCQKERFTLADAEAGVLPGQMGSWLFRNIFRKFTPEQARLYQACNSVGDAKLALILSLFGDFYCDPSVMSAHRLVIDETSFSSRSYTKNLSLEYLDWAASRERLALEAFGRTVNLDEIRRDVAYHAFVAVLRAPRTENVAIFRQVMRRQPSKGKAWADIMRRMTGIAARRRARQAAGNCAA